LKRSDVLQCKEFSNFVLNTYNFLHYHKLALLILPVLFDCVNGSQCFSQQNSCVCNKVMTFGRDLHPVGGRNSVFCIVTRFRLDGSGIESRWGRDFSHVSRLALQSTQPTIKWVLGLSAGVKRPERGVNHQPPSSDEVKEKVQLNLYFASVPSWQVIG
jgi:hypothetical protein